MPRIRLTWDEPPATDVTTTPSATDIADSLRARPGKWAIVSYVDRAARAAGTVERIEAGTEYGPGFEAVNRRVGNQHRVYARFVG